MGKEKKRERAANWSEEEKDTLLNDVSLYINEIEDKKTDGRATERKETAWQIVYQEFCLIHGQSRSAKQLKEMWKRLKDIAKKEVSKYNKELKRTGGGPQPDPLSEFCLRIKDLIPNEFKQHHNPYDDDAAQGSTNDVEELVEVNRPTIEVDNESIDEREVASLNVKRKSSTTSDSINKIMRTADIETSIMKMSTEEHDLKMKFLTEEHTARMKLIRMQTMVAESILEKVTNASSVENVSSIETNNNKLFSYLELLNKND